MTTSYPYLRCAERLGLPYGLVLSFADVLGRLPAIAQSYWEQKALNQLTPEQMSEILNVRIAEIKRQENVIAEETMQKALAND